MRMMKWGLGVLGLAAVGVIAVAAVGVGSSASAQTPPANDQSNTQTRAERYRELLAQELGISVQDLTDAQTNARNKLIDEEVAAGKITAEQGDKLKSMDLGAGLQFGFDHPGAAGVRNAIVSVFQTAADVVGVPVDELRSRIAGGESLVDIAASKNIDETTLKSDLTSALTDKINQAVTDGNLTQDKADTLLQNLDDMVSRAINASGPFQGRFGNGDFHPFRMRGNQN